MKIGVIGAGPAGIFASLEARKANAEVLLFDSNEIIGRKLLVTGAGRCNLTNENAFSNKYIANPLSTVNAILNQFGHPELLDYLHNLGVFTQSTSDGWVYPLSYSAANVADILAAHIIDSDIKVNLSHKVSRIILQKHGFLLKFSTGQSTLFVDKLIVAAGGKAYPSLGSDGSIIPALQNLGHEIHPIQPALAPLVIPNNIVSPIQGVRMDAGVSLFSNCKLIGHTLGNIIFTKNGINGPGVMDISYLVNQYKNSRLEVKINFIAGHENTLNALLARFADSSMPLQSVLGAIVPPKISLFTLNNLGLTTNTMMKNLHQNDSRRIMEFLSSFSLKIKGVRGFQYCQLSTGGIPLLDVEAESLESKKIPGLSFAGEILDVHGPCGGYNLQWAFSSGFVAGRHAAS